MRPTIKRVTLTAVRRERREIFCIYIPLLRNRSSREASCDFSVLKKVLFISGSNGPSLVYILSLSLFVSGRVSRVAWLPPSFSTHEDVLEKLLRDQPVRSGWTLGRCAIKSAVDSVELRTDLASHIEPPVADEDRLAELRAVRAEKRCLSTVYVAIMPGLASCLHVGEEAGKGLVVAVEIRVGYLPQHWIIRAWSTCNCNEYRISKNPFARRNNLLEAIKRRIATHRINVIVHTYFNVLIKVLINLI